MKLLCPNCRTEMEPVVIGGVEIDYCPSCHGIWLDEGELQELAKYDAKEFKGVEQILMPPSTEEAQGGLSSSVSERICPRCNVKLYTYKYGGNSDIVIDGCPQCGGIWLDAGELAKILNYMRELDRPLTPEEEAIVRQALTSSRLRMKALEDEAVGKSFLARIANAIVNLIG